ncbi:predicted protein [Sclerotinia sclerotiorum 1980 UF-70]|uniref:Uncharacterized protein n=1 Tax=Sclerotinia sclerotiorum (strain ATCC 18683 / 1980 / Ss-1) TaxID=665079 RepID=A7EI60_SCLS1|nr:predicted protein [Sclerotinia sclerotiorum 1980 UF-70]EDO02526.1 predicted protein [Sclerotinia sclerotiorum 1980 UF-70]
MIPRHKMPDGLGSHFVIFNIMEVLTAPVNVAAVNRLQLFDLLRKLSFEEAR